MIRDKIHHELRHATSDLSLQVRHINKNIRRIEDVANEIPDYKPMIRVKSIVVMQELIAVSWHPMLQEVVFWTCEQWPEQIVFTSGYRKGSKGVHGQNPLRGGDLRSREFKNPRQVEDAINQEWDYGKINSKTGQPYQVCLYHQSVRCEKCGKKFRVDPDMGIIASTTCPGCFANREFLKDFGPHFHLQSRDQTRRRA